MNISEMLATLLPHLDLKTRPWRADTGNNLGHQATRWSGRLHDGSNNHGQGTPKKRVQMSARSNQINRRRCRRWKH